MGLKKLILVLSILLSLTAFNVFGTEDGKKDANDLTPEQEKEAKAGSKKKLGNSFFPHIYFYLMPTPLQKNQITVSEAVIIYVKDTVYTVATNDRRIAAHPIGGQDVASGVKYKLRTFYTFKPRGGEEQTIELGVSDDWLTWDKEAFLIYDGGLGAIPLRFAGMKPGVTYINADISYKVGNQTVQTSIDLERGAAKARDEANAFETDAVLFWDKKTDINFTITYRDDSGINRAKGKVEYPGDNKGIRIEIPSAVKEVKE